MYSPKSTQESKGNSSNTNTNSSDDTKNKILHYCKKKKKKRIRLNNRGLQNGCHSQFRTTGPKLQEERYSTTTETSDHDCPSKKLTTVAVQRETDHHSSLCRDMRPQECNISLRHEGQRTRVYIAGVASTMNGPINSSSLGPRSRCVRTLLQVPRG